jgi:mono/diheme cytochrome c family protein
MKNLKLISIISFLCLIILALFAFWEFSPKSNLSREYMPDMYDSTNFKAQSEDKNSKDGAAARIPPTGTIPRGYQPYHYGPFDTLKAGEELINPLPRTKSVLGRGQKIFNTYCIVCHGPKGNGEGYIVPPYPRPPTLLSDKIRNYKDGSIFNVITNGQNIMPSYKTQIKAEDRWAVIHYVRALQRADRPTDEDIKELNSEGEGQGL